MTQTQHIGSYPRQQIGSQYRQDPQRIDRNNISYPPYEHQYTPYHMEQRHMNSAYHRPVGYGHSFRHGANYFKSHLNGKNADQRFYNQRFPSNMPIPHKFKDERKKKLGTSSDSSDSYSDSSNSTSSSSSS